MRLTGTLEAILRLENAIRRFPDCQVIKDKLVNQPCRAAVEPSFLTHAYLLYVMPYEFKIRIELDHRNKTGVFQMPDYNSHLLFIKYPLLAQMLSETISGIGIYNEAIKNFKRFQELMRKPI